MAKWTVGELKDELDGYGDHVPVAVFLNPYKDNEQTIQDFVVNDISIDGEVVFVLEVET